jgi:hypothetical protein
MTERDFASDGVLDMRSRFTFLRDAYHTRVEYELLMLSAQERSVIAHESLALPGKPAKRAVNERCTPLVNPEKSRPDDTSSFA